MIGDRARGHSRLNPPGSQLGRINAIMAGTGPHVVSGFVGPLSIKTMLRGRGTWRTDDGLYVVEEGHALVLRAGQRYSLDFPVDEPHASFCPCFADGFVEDVARGETAATECLLDAPDGPGRTLGFAEHVMPLDGPLAEALGALRRCVAWPLAELDDVEAGFRALALALVHHMRAVVPAAAARIPALRTSTRAECLRRVSRARDYLHAHAHEPLDLACLARVAALSPHHLHRLFAATFGEPPHRYLVRIRLARAARMLARTDAPVASIAHGVGFATASGFSARFTRSYGVGPAAYRRDASGAVPQ